MLLQLLRVSLAQANIEVTRAAQTGREAIEFVRIERPEVAIFDISMPELDGLEALAEAKSASPSTIFIVLTAHANVKHLARALAAGASAFLSKSNRDLSTIPNTVNTLLRGEAAIIDQGLLQQAFQETQTENLVLWPDCETILKALTPREKEVLRLIGQGKTNHQIADEIVVTYNTVKTHVQSILEKTGVSDRTQAALVAHRCGLVES
jgi:NarL family two-component system response regulator LiaR